MYHLAIKPLSRSAGRSATAAAAYRAGVVVVDERTGEVHDYTRKRDIEHSELLVPAGAPAWATERTALWNAAEAAEKRKDARVARDYEVAIPKELTREQGLALVRDFAQRLVDAYGVAVDVNVHRDELRHWDGSEKGWQGYHAHLLASTRRLGPDGFGEKTTIELSDTKRKSLGLGDGAAEIARVREWWEIDANRHLEQAHQAQRIDRRSLKDQGLDREPTVHLGPAVTLLERGGIPSRLGDINRQVVAEHQVRLAQRQQVAEMAVEIDALSGEIAEGKAKGTERGARPEPAARRPDAPARPVEVGLTAPETEAIREFLVTAVRKRDQRVQQVLAKAQKRQQRREKARQALVQAEPAVPKGVLAVFRQKGHRQAQATWEVAKAAAAKLIEQARQLAERLVQIAEPQRLKVWAYQVLKREQPEVVARFEAQMRHEQRAVVQPSPDRDANPRAAVRPATVAPVEPPVPSRDASAPQPGPAPGLQPGQPGAKRDWGRYKTLQEELAKKGMASLQERGAVPPTRDIEPPPPERRKDRGRER